MQRNALVPIWIPAPISPRARGLFDADQRDAVARQPSGRRKAADAASGDDGWAGLAWPVSSGGMAAGACITGMLVCCADQYGMCACKFSVIRRRSPKANVRLGMRGRRWVQNRVLKSHWRAAQFA